MTFPTDPVLNTDTHGDHVARTNEHFADASQHLRADVNVAAFGAVSSATAAQTTQAFQDALDYAASSGKKYIFVPARDTAYNFDGPLFSDRVAIIGEHRQGCVLFWGVGTISTGAYCISFINSLGGYTQHPALSNLTIYGPNQNPDFGSHPADFHGLRLGQDGSDATFRINNIEIGGFDYNFVLENNTGHCFFDSVTSQNGHYGFYVRRGNADYSWISCDITSNRMAGIGMPRNTGLNVASFWKCHFGFEPYGIYQCNVDDTSTPGPRNAGFMSYCDLIGCDFEAVGNAAIKSEADETGGSGVFYGNLIRGGWHDYAPEYQYLSHNKNYYLSVPNAGYNRVEWGAKVWPAGTSAILNYGGIGAWTFEGAPNYSWANVSNTSSTQYNQLDRGTLNAYTITIPATQTAATFTYDTYLLLAADALRPQLTPKSDPGGRFWISAYTSTGFTVTREGTLPAVTFEIQF
jgi:hypothetical protein